MSIGSFYNKKGVIVGQAAGFYAPEDTPLVGDSSTVFDESVYCSTKVSVGAATAGTFSLTLSGGPLPAPVTISNISYNITATALAALIQAVLPSTSYTAVVVGTGAAVTPWTISLVGPAASRIIITGSGTGLTGGAFVLTPSLWTPCGATEQGWQSNYDVSTQDIRIEEQITPVGRNITDASMSFVANLSEDTIENLKLAMASNLAVTSPGAGVYGRSRLTLSSDLPVFAVILETRNRFKLPRRYYIPGATCAVNVGQTFARARGQRLIPVTFSSVCETERIVIDDITAVPTS